MKEKIEQLFATVKANKGPVIRVAGVVLGALVGVTVATILVNAQENAGFETDEPLQIDDESVNIEETE